MDRPIHRILIVDDSHEDAQTYRDSLNDAPDFDAEVTVVETARAAIERIANFEYDCILLDYHLPDADGIKVLQQLKQSRATVPPVVMVTGQGDERLAVRAMQWGAQDYVVKARDTGESMVRAVRSAIAHARVAQNLEDERRRVEREQTIRLQAQEREIELLGELRRERSRFENILAQIPSPIAVLRGLGQTFEFSNVAMDRLLESRRGTSLTRMSDVLGAEMSELARLVFVARKRYEAMEFELDDVGSRGESMCFHLVLEPQVDSDGTVGGVLLAMNDVSSIVRARKLAEASEDAARESGDRFRKIAEVFPNAICVFEPGGRLEYLNQAFHDITGWTTETFHRNSWRRGIHPKDRRFVRDLWAQSARRGKEFEASFRLKNRGSGLYRWHTARAVPFENEHGEIVKWYGSLIDNHDERTLTQNLRDSEQRLETATRSSSVGIWELDVATHDVWSNAQFRSIMGQVASDLSLSSETMSEAILFEDRPRFDFELRRAIQSEEAIEGEFRVLWPNQSLHWIRLRAGFDVSSSGVRRILGTVIDITDSKQREQDLQDARNAAMQANASKTSFLANMSHEIRTPLTAIMGFTEVLGFDDLSVEDRREYSGTISRNARTLMQIIDDILDLSKMEAGKLAVHAEDVSLTRILEDLRQTFGPIAEGKGIEFTIDADEALPAQIETDPVRLRQILNNALSNAMKFTQKGGVSVRLYRCGDVAGKSSLCFTVTDSGIGISEDDQRSLFQPFVQADSTLTRRFGGTGLGLMLSRRLARLLGGAFFLARSEVGSGSTFELRLPFVKNEEVREPSVL